MWSGEPWNKGIHLLLVGLLNVFWIAIWRDCHNVLGFCKLQYLEWCLDQLREFFWMQWCLPKQSNRGNRLGSDLPEVPMSNLMRVCSQCSTWSLRHILDLSQCTELISLQLLKSFLLQLPTTILLSHQKVSTCQLHRCSPLWRHPDKSGKDLCFQDDQQITQIISRFISCRLNSQWIGLFWTCNFLASGLWKLLLIHYKSIGKLASKLDCDKTFCQSTLWWRQLMSRSQFFLPTFLSKA